MVVSAFRRIDSHHIFIRSRLAMHGCIDSYSRLVIYLHCCNNNKAETVKAQFLQSISSFFWPKRPRSDHGMENIGVALFGLPSKTFSTGLLVHNQNTELLWNDVFHYVLHYHIDLIYFVEANEILDPLNKVHLLVLQE